ncbi:MAG: polysulfide reductase NrfD [Fimbriimonadaceae bacterium]|nr:polysulfide reductase NrfD [Fimbriimonadaceae bacterium]
MQYGFVINQDTCIGCHACTTACKAENGVPLGNFRTSVKYVEVGKYPDVKRNFLVQRCNHCTDAPCVTICPVNALKKRPDGIVDVDRDACIGCRACMQACPYDALYLNEDKGAVEKCHFCAHRVERGLEPACVTVCPVGAIVPGDFHDPTSRVSLMLKQHETKTRRPEQKTGPNVRYIGASPAALEPGVAERRGAFLWSEDPARKPELADRSGQSQAEALLALDTDHKVEWGWPVALYLLTKGLAAGLVLMAPFAARGATDWRYEAGALLFTLITLFLLVEDLAKPGKFYTMLTRPNFKSWLVKGGMVLTVFSLLIVATLVAQVAFPQPTGVAVAAGSRAVHWTGGLVEGLRLLNWPVALLAAGYTAFLFAQCKGRDLWESKQLLPHLLVQAVLCGSVVALALEANPGWVLKTVAVVAIVGHLQFVFRELTAPHPTANASQAVGFLRKVRLGVVPAFDASLWLLASAVVLVVLAPFWAWVPALVGLYLYEHAFVRAGQLPPLS